MATFADRLRRWYEHERDSNAKCLEMLSSVPMERRGDPQFQKAVDRLAHLNAARRRWLYRLGHLTESPVIFPQGVPLTDLPAQLADTEQMWTSFLATLDEAQLERVAEWQGPDGGAYRGELSEILTQLNGHAWYHRGQIAQLVAAVGGEAIDTDYIYWCGIVPRLPRP